MSKTLHGSPAEFQDREGWFDLSLRSDGAATVKVYAPPNRINRNASFKGAAGDVTFTVDDLSGFIYMLSQAYMEGMEVIEADEEQVTKAVAVEKERLETIRDYDGTKPPSKQTLQEQQITELRVSYGIQQLPFEKSLDVIGEALGLKQGFYKEKGEWKPMSADETDEEFLARCVEEHEALAPVPDPDEVLHDEPVVDAEVSVEEPEAEPETTQEQEPEPEPLVERHGRGPNKKKEKA